eukprot:349602-Chlamydomonas_euryale.AAC.5
MCTSPSDPPSSPSRHLETSASTLPHSSQRFSAAACMRSPRQIEGKVEFQQDLRSGRGGRLAADVATKVMGKCGWGDREGERRCGAAAGVSLRWFWVLSRMEGCWRGSKLKRGAVQLLMWHDSRADVCAGS